MDKVEKFYIKYKDYLTSIKDLTAGDETTFLFFVLVTFYGYLLKDNPEETISMSGLKIRNYLNKVLKLFGPNFLMVRQVFEDRNDLVKNDNLYPFKYFSDDIALPETPVIWAANHAFKDDTLATVLAAKRNAYIVFGSLPQFYNTVDGFTAWINGVIMTNRKIKNSRRASIDKSKYVLERGKDLIIFPEGVWNKSPNKIVLDFWPGVYRSSYLTKTPVVPVVHYLADLTEKDKNSLIHTVIDEPIPLYEMEEKEGLEYLKEVMCTWYYLMMEKYGHDTRANVLRGFNNADEAWEHHLIERVKTADRYDLEIEVSADYRNRELESKRLEEISMWENIANINQDNIDALNIKDIMHAKEKVKELKRVDFQRRF